MPVRSNAVRELESSLSRIHQLPRLETINLTFDPIYNNYSNVDLDHLGCDALQETILRTLSASFNIRAPSKLTSLSLHNLRTSDPSALETLPFQTILPTLRFLHLAVLFDSLPNPSTFLDRWHHFWSNLFPRMPTVPIQTQLSLTELTLHSDEYVGTHSGLSFRDLYSPRLSILSLRGIVFDPSLGAEDFILRHAGTLSRLKLLECKVLMSANRFPSPTPSTTIATDVELSPSPYWDRIWDRFAEELTTLVTLYVDEPHDNGGVRTSKEIRYVHYRPGRFREYMLIYGNESRIAADLAALKRFYVTVAARARSKKCEGRGCA